MESRLDELKRLVEESGDIVFFGGAGVSTESGIPDFRGTGGLYNMEYKYPPETILSHSFYEAHPEEFFRFYRDKILFSGIKPSRAHIALAKMERAGKLSAVVTQNIDSLHQAAGSKKVYELHGSIERNYCTRCGRFFSKEEIDTMPLVPICPCGGRIKPDVVLYEEALDGRVLEKSIKAIAECDLLIVGGTSLTVYPASGLLRYFKGSSLVIINKTETPYSSMATLSIYGSIGEALEYAARDIKELS
ncbi:MAG: NAD-dependent protein deacylase [Clostridiaceae bacterium]|nr:NAD-dependent protein deacylase [Clostridiaceae bacterium]